MKQSDVIEKAKINALARVSERVKVRQLTEYGKDARRVYNDPCSILRVGRSSMSGDIMCKITCQGRGI